MKLAKAYEPSEYESDIYALWEKSGAFKPTKSGESYSVVVPPPNANGSIHLGTAFTLALEDIIIRYQRLRGKSALLLPGADHAGFETQVVYERHLAKEGKSRFDFTREQLYKQIWDFVAHNRKNFESQFRRVGASVDWSRYTFTLDQKIVKRAYKTFHKMWDEGLIYRSERLVNYCTHHRTSFADIEVDYKESTTPLHYIQYGPFKLATTRPETIFGDTAVAVHPDDARYAKYVGKVVEIEGPIGPFPVQVVADEMVDRNFGTGVVKITPAHSFDDFEVAERHDLPSKRVINHDGTLNHQAGKFAGLTVDEARKQVLKTLKEKGLLIRTDTAYQNRVGCCYKCGTVIEPMLMDQWFVDMQPLADGAIKALKAGQITFYPESKKHQLISYLQGLRDWNISRQIAWGIPIPAFQNVDDPDDWIYDERVSQETITVSGKTYRRDPDVFDTWFSSSSWPYATLNFDDPKSTDFKDFYPLNLMETGGEILYPWVSRMIMLGLYITGEVPFKAVYIHGYVMAEDGSKMSKSLGNVINPDEVIDTYGSDAMRMGIIAGRVPAVNRGYDHRKVEDARNFCNKLWNIARYIEDKLGQGKPGALAPKTAADHWIVAKLNQAAADIAEHLGEYRFAEAYDALYHFVWDDFADWYIEASKAEENLPLLKHCLESILVIAHPFAPFLTETIWQTLPHMPAKLAVAATWPKPLKHSAKLASDFDQVKAIVTEVRAITKAVGIKQTSLTFKDAPVIDANAALIARLARLEAVGLGEADDKDGVRLTGVPYTAILAVSRVDADNYLIKLASELQTAQTAAKNLTARLNNKGYVQNAPKKVVEESRQQLTAAEDLIQTIKAEQKRFK